MNISTLTNRFEKMGAKLRFQALDSHVRQGWNGGLHYTVDVHNHEGDEVFDFAVGRGVEMDVVDINPKDRHLLLLVKSPRQRLTGSTQIEKVRYLCGHDERHWFVAPVPGTPTTVVQAKEQLKPSEAIQSQVSAKLGIKKSQKRHNKAFVRQGEWFFIPQPDLTVPALKILKNEPLQRATRRGFNKPHMVAELYRIGGSTVYVCRQYPQGVQRNKYEEIMRSDDASKYVWRTMQLNPTVYVRGKITHPDHKTLTLNMWHKVVMNREGDSPVGDEMRFVD